MNRQSSTGSSRSESRSPQGLWVPGQDIRFAGSEGLKVHEPNIGSLWAPAVNIEPNEDLAVRSDSLPQALQRGTEGSSRTRPAKVYQNKPSTQSSALRPDSHVEPGPLLLSTNHIASKPHLTRNVTRRKSSLISARDRVSSPQKLTTVLPKSPPYPGQSSSLPLRRAVPRPKKLVKDIPSATSEDTTGKEMLLSEIAKREEMEHTDELRRREKQKTDENDRRQREKQERDAWEAPLRRKVDAKLSPHAKKLETIRKDISNLRVIVQSTSTLLRKLRIRCRQRQTAKSDIEHTMREIQLVQRGLDALREVKRRWAEKARKEHEMNVRFAKITGNPSDVETSMAALQSKFDDIQNHEKLTQMRQLIMRQLMKHLKNSAKSINTLSHRWRAYRRATFLIDNSPVPAAWAFRHNSMPVLERAEELSFIANEILDTVYQLKSKLPPSLLACASNSIFNCESIRQIIAYELAAFGSTIFQSSDPSLTSLNEWQRQTWRRFMLQLVSSSQLKNDLWNHYRCAPVSEPKRAKLNVALNKYEAIRRKYRRSLEHCIEASWARAADDHNRGVHLCANKRADPQYFAQSDNELAEATDKNARPSSNVPQSHMSHSYWQFNRYRTGDGEKISVHICTSVSTSERVARLFSDDKILGFDLEWKPYARRDDPHYVALLQLANDKHVALFHLSQMQLDTVNDTEGAVFLRRRIAPTLRSILENKLVRKVGVNIKADHTRLGTTYQVDMAGLFELSHLHQQLNYQPNGGKAISKRAVALDKQATEYFGLPIAKGQERCSNWQDRLNLSQIFCTMMSHFNARC